MGDDTGLHGLGRHDPVYGAGRVASSPRGQRHPAVADVRGRIQAARLEVADLRRRQRRLVTDLDRLSGALRDRLAGGRSAVDPPRAADASAPAGSAPPHEPRLYAPNPVGRVSAAARDVVPPPPAAVPIENYFDVTNLGTLIDVLA